ncbi:MAG: hypothetical protein Fur0022_42400 [Anaerolineales bacterium]
MTDPIPTETTLALHIQEGRATDPAIATHLVKHFAPGVQQFTLSLLNGHPEAPETAKNITRQSFAEALNDPESFMGKENIRAWLYARALRQTHALPLEKQARPNPTPTGEPFPGLETLTPQETLPLLLRYGHRLPLDEIAHLLRTSENKIHKHLTTARQKLIQQITKPAAQQSPISDTSTKLSTSFQSLHPLSHFPRETQRLLDHLLAPEAEANFREHLETCPDCRTHLTQYAELEFHLNTRLHHAPPLPEEQIQDIVQAVIFQDIPQRKPTLQLPSLPRLPVREMSWVLVAVVAFFILARWLNPFFSSPPPPATPRPTATLPPAQALSTVFRQSDPALLISQPFSGPHSRWSLTHIHTGDHIPTTPLVFSSSGRLAAFGNGTEVVLWPLDDLDNGNQTIYNVHTTVVTALEFLPDETMLATGDETGRILVWDLEEDRVRFQLRNHPGPIRHIAISSDGRYLAVALNEGVWVWEMKERTIQLIQKYRWEWVRLVAFSPDGNLLAAADRENTVALWSFPAGKFLMRYKILENEEEHRLDLITRFAFSPDSRKLATGTFDGIVEVVSLAPIADGGLQGTRLFALTHPSWISEVRWSPDGTRLATVADTGPLGGPDTASRAVYLWDSEKGTLLEPPLTARITRGLSRALFTPDGTRLLTSNFDGAVFEWTYEDVSHLVAAVSEPQFFVRAENNLFSGSLPEDVLPIRFTDPLSTTLKFLPFLLAQLQLQPSEQYHLIEGRASFNGAIVALYYQTEQGKSVIITQRPFSAEALSAIESMIGASAVVEPIQIRGTMGEYVLGSWVLTTLDNVDETAEASVYRWSTTGEARLRWVQAGLLMEIRTPVYQFDADSLSQSELLRLAENLVAQIEAPIIFPYTVQDGDTCFSIALQYGTTIDRIAAVNEFATCDLIVIGQTLLIPLPTARETLTETDLNCDGSPERIQVIPDPNLADLSANFGVVVETVPPGGSRYWPIWQRTIADVPAAFFGLPQIFRGSECEMFLGVSIFGSTRENSGLDLYRWTGMEAEQVLDANGYVVDVVTPGANGLPPFRITTQSLIRDPAAGGCTRTTTTYEWNGTMFIQIEEIRVEGVDCLDG